MNLHTIQPLAAALNQNDKPYLKLGDLEQIVTKINNQRKRKLTDARQKHSVVVEDNYLKVLSHLRKSFKNQPRLDTAEILRLTDQFIQDNNFLYFPRRHPVAHRNVFYDKADKVYDVAFFNHAARGFIECHHKYRGLSSVFYARFEEKDDHVLIGNLQIDDRHQNNSWTQNDLRTILLMRKNIYRAMLQECLKFALAGKKTRIFFQTGDAGQHAQKTNISYRVKKIKFNSQNYAKYHTMHEELLNKFDAVQPGDQALNFNYRHGRHGIVIEKGPKSYKSVFSCLPHCQDAKSLDSLLDAVHSYYDQTHEWRYRREPHECCRTELGKKILEIDAKMLNNYALNKPLGVLNEINKVFTIIKPDYTEKNRKEKLAYLREHLRPTYHAGDAHGVIDKFLIKYKYHEIFLNQFPFMRMIKVLPDAPQNSNSGMGFYDTRYEKYITETFERSKIIVPEIGKTILVNESFASQELIEADFFEKRMYNFYDKELPKLFAQAGLKFKKTLIRTKIDGKIVRSAAWEIKTGIKKFKERPLVIF